MLLVAGGLLVLVWILLSVTAPPEAPVEMDRQRLQAARRLRSPVYGPSGIACDTAGGRLFVVGDRGHVAELDLEGRERSRQRVPGDLEDIAVLGGGKLLILDESADEVFSYDYDAGREETRWTLDVAGLLGTPRAPLTDNGFEGLAFVPDRSHGSAGLLYLVHQHRPALAVVAAFDARGQQRRLGAESVRARWNLERYGDAKAVTYAAALDRFLVVSDAADRLVVLTADGTVTGELPLDGRQQEGVCLDGKDTLWVTDDGARRLLAFAHPMEALRAVASRYG